MLNREPATMIAPETWRPIVLIPMLSLTLTARIMKYIDKRMTLKKIAVKTGADPVFVEDVARMYLTHQNVGPQGILDRIEIKGR